MQKKPLDSRRRSEPTLLGAHAFAAISAVEGLKLTAAGRKRVLSSAPIEQRRAEILKAYTELKERK